MRYRQYQDDFDKYPIVGSLRRTKRTFWLRIAPRVMQTRRIYVDKKGDEYFMYRMTWFKYPEWKRELNKRSAFTRRLCDMKPKNYRKWIKKRESTKPQVVLS